MKVLGLESSCDETAAAIVDTDGWRVLGSEVATQFRMHRDFGGVVPEIAARAHLDVIDHLVESVLAKAGASLDQVDAIAVTQGPGLIGALLVGLSYARGLATALERPLIPVDHVHAHLHGALMGCYEQGMKDDEIFPSLGFVVSGGHTNLYLWQGPLSFELLGYTVDDACGEAFDKVAKLLGLAHPGGPALEALASKARGQIQVSMPNVRVDGLEFGLSYSGLKTAAVLAAREFGAGAALSSSSPGDLEAWKADLAQAFQHAAFGQIVRKLKAAYRRYPDVRSVLVAGGVAANRYFRDLLRDRLPEVPAHFPPLAYCADNGVMIAALGGRLLLEDPTWQSLEHDCEAYPRYPYERYLRTT